MNRLRRTDWNASPAIDTTGWINVELGGVIKTRFAFLRVNAVGRTNIHAKLVLDALIGDDVGHEIYPKLDRI